MNSIKRDFETDLFTDGFYDFDKNATMKFLYDNEMEWGGFYGTKLDGMHFGLKYSKIGNYLK